MIDPLALVRSLEGKRPWNVQLGVGSFLVFDFGRKVQLSEKLAAGEWSLWIRCTPWRLRTEKRLLLGSEEDREKIAANITQMENRAITRCELDPHTLDLLIEFDSGVRLETFSFAVADYEHWSLRHPEDMVLTAGPGFRMRHGKADESPDEHAVIELGTSGAI